MYRHDTTFGRKHHYDARHHHRPHPHGSRTSRYIAIGVIGALSVWAGTASLYILFRDDALKLIIEQQVATTRSYQAQAGQLQSEIERLRSLKLIDQERVERALADLVRRQTVIATRQSALSAIGGSITPARDGSADITGSLRPPEIAPPASDRTPPKPTPLSDTILIAPPSERVARLESRPLPPVGARQETRLPVPAIENQITGLARELARLESEQSRALNRIETAYDERERRMRKVFADLGVSAAAPAKQTAQAFAGAATGGPFLPWSRPPEDPFARQLHRIRTAALAVEALEQDIASVPVRRPTLVPADVTSGFGVRLDPFVRQLAMHTGVDFRAEAGDPVRATAAGKVMQAERNGGYGLMVEVEHANGLSTRYAHLSAIDVAAGSVIPAGTIIGRAGSTGRSTGPHVHYEVRANGEPIDPQRFLRAGLRLVED